MGRLLLALVLIAWLPGAAVIPAQETPTLTPSPAPPPPAAVPPDGRPGMPAPPGVVAEIQFTLDTAVARFTALDEGGVLTHVSDQYRTAELTKVGIADQIRAVYKLHDRVWVRVRIDDVRLVGDVAWVYSTGRITGRLRYLGGLIVVATWERELEVARRENGRWRLYGYQQ